MNLLKFGKTLNITLVIVFLIFIGIRVLSRTNELIDYQAFKMVYIIVSSILVLATSLIVSLDHQKN